MAISTPPPPGSSAPASGPLLDPATAAAAPARAAALDLHGGIDDPYHDPRSASCRRSAEHHALVNAGTGELLPIRCKATNLCRYCQTLYVVETVEMLTLDAAEYAPNLWAVLTAREHLTRADCRRHLTQLRRAARKRWPAIEWFVQVEFQRRGALHLNLLIKGVPDEDADELLTVLSRAWCRRVDAAPVGQWVGIVAEAEGVVRYLQKTLSHGLKREQAPPLGWRGHRTSQTAGYLVRPASVMREEARAALRLKRLLHRGLTLQEAELELAAAPEFKFVRVPGMKLGRDLDRERQDAARAPFRPRFTATAQGASSARADVTAGPTRTAPSCGGTAPKGYPPPLADRTSATSPPGDVRGLDTARGLGAGSPPRVANP